MHESLFFELYCRCNIQGPLTKPKRPRSMRIFIFFNLTSGNRYLYQKVTINNVVGQIVLGQLEYGMVHIRPYVNTGIKKFDHGVLVWHGRYGIQYSMVCHISLTIQCHGMVRCRYMVLGDMVWYGMVYEIIWHACTI